MSRNAGVDGSDRGDASTTASLLPQLVYQRCPPRLRRDFAYRSPRSAYGRQLGFVQWAARDSNPEPTD